MTCPPVILSLLYHFTEKYGRKIEFMFASFSLGSRITDRKNHKAKLLYHSHSTAELDVAESNFGLMKDATHAKMQMLLAAKYAGGELSFDEKKTLISSGLFTETSFAKTFTDISDYSWAKKEIEVLASKGVINGTSPHKHIFTENVGKV